jgi:pyruvate,water dikinase
MQEQPKPHIVWFRDIGKKDIQLVGGKGANLGEMTKAGIPVPNGFCVTSPAYFYFIETNKLEEKIRKVLENLDVNNGKALNEASKKVKDLIMRGKIPADLEKEINDAYQKFPIKNQLVAVRSSATAEDLPGASFAGQQATYLNIQGKDTVVKTIHKCWASLFESRAIFYRNEKKFDHFKVGIAVPVQIMVQSDVSGVMFTLNPINNDKSVIVVESVWGLGEMIVQGTVTPDHYEVDRTGWKLLRKEIVTQEIMLTKLNGETKETKVPASKKNLQKIPDRTVVQIAKIGEKLQRHYDYPQDIEWAYDDREIYIVQTRPITTIESVEHVGESATIIGKIPEPIVSGSSASPGIVSGKATLLRSPEENDKVQQGNILVAPMTTPDFVPAMKRAAAIVTDQGGQTSHAAIVSRELGVPCIVGSGSATKRIQNGQTITVDAVNGLVYAGALEIKRTKIELPKGIESIRDVKTNTKIYVNLGEPEMAKEISQMYVDGVGLLRAEFIISEYIGIHPRLLIEQGKKKFFIDKLAEGLVEFCKHFTPRPIIYRTTDFKSNEYKGLKGGEKYEKEEANPMIGFRGAHRYLVDDEVFNMELAAIKKVRETEGFKNLFVMIPFVRTVSQMLEVKHLMAKSGLVRSHNFKLYMMAEIPNNVLMLDEFIDVGIDGVSIGSNDLTMLILGTDRDNEMVADVYDERNQGVQKALEIVVRTCKRRGISCSICGQAPSMYPEITKNLVSWGATSVSVSPDMINKTRLIVYNVEKELKKQEESKTEKKRMKVLSVFQKMFKK